MHWSRVDPLAYFASLVSPQESVPVFEAAVALSHVAAPGLDLQAVLVEMDVLTLRLRARLPSDASAGHRLKLLHHVFFDELAFGGNANDFYSAPNGLVSDVLRTRRGIPASLAVIYVELARSIGLAAEGVAFPGHFLVRVRQASGGVFIDPLTGRSLGRSVLEAWLAPYLEAAGRSGSMEGSFTLDDASWSHMLAPVGARDWLLHLLRHLEAAYRVSDEAMLRRRVLQRIVLLQSPGEVPKAGGAARPARRRGASPTRPVDLGPLDVRVSRSGRESGRGIS